MNWANPGGSGDEEIEAFIRLIKLALVLYAILIGVGLLAAIFGWR